MILKKLLILKVTISLNITFNSIIHHLAKHADLVIDGIKRAIKNKTVTYDFERLMPDAILLSSSEFGKAIIKHMDA